MKKRWNRILDAISRHAKIFFPILIVILVAITVIVALKMSNINKEKLDQLEQMTQEISSEQESETIEEKVEISLVKNDDPAVNALIATYYHALAEGDEETLFSVTENMEEKDIYINREKAKYIKDFPLLEVYSKPGYDEKSLIAFVYSKTVFEGKPETEFIGYRAYVVDTREDGSFYIKMGGFTEEESDYILKISSQEDIIDFNNRIVVEHNEMMEKNPDCLEYLNDLMATIEKDAGIALAQVRAEREALETVQEPETEEEAVSEEEPLEEPEEIILYVKTTAAVNVRASDSEKADKLGKASKGMKLQVVEQRANGWTKVIFEGKEGYIKSEYLKLQDTTAGLTAVGTVEATANVNVRAQASEKAIKLGALSKGTVVNFYDNENGWYKIEFNGQIGYVKSSYVK